MRAMNGAQHSQGLGLTGPVASPPGPCCWAAILLVDHHWMTRTVPTAVAIVREWSKQSHFDALAHLSGRRVPCATPMLPCTAHTMLGEVCCLRWET